MTYAIKLFSGVILAVAAIAAAAAWLTYGSLDPCEMLKKEVAWHAREGNGQGGYILFGGLINNAINTLTPIQCAGAVVRLRSGEDASDIMSALREELRSDGKKR